MNCSLIVKEFIEIVSDFTELFCEENNFEIRVCISKSFHYNTVILKEVGVKCLSLKLTVDYPIFSSYAFLVN